MLKLTSSFLSIMIVSSVWLSTPAQAETTLKIQWQSLGMEDNKFARFPLEGAKIILKDQEENELDTAYFEEGQVTFPISSHQISKIILQASFPGLALTEDVENQTKLGEFQIFDANDNTCTQADTVYQKEFELNDFIMKNGVYTYTFPGENKIWPTFHSLVDLIHQLKERLTLEKEVGFGAKKAAGQHLLMTLLDTITGLKVLSNASASRYSEHCMQVHPQDSDNWDVIGRLLSHLLLEERQVLKDEASDILKEGIAIWLSIALQERSSYKGQRLNIGDKIYYDAPVTENLEENLAAADCNQQDEFTVARLFWDLYDAANTQGNADIYQCTTGRDRTTLGLQSIWAILDQAQLANLDDFWRRGFLIESDVNNFLQVEKAADKKIFRNALSATDSFAEFAEAPSLTAPITKSRLDFGVTPEWVFNWTQVQNDEMSKLVLYSEDLDTVVLEKAEIPTNEYILTEEDLLHIEDIADPAQAAVIAVVMAGHYVSNPVELFYQAHNRAAVMVVDSSGSNQSTDPEDVRIPAGQKALNCLLVSQQDASLLDKPKGSETSPACSSTTVAINEPFAVLDLGATIDFDNAVSVLSYLTDPDGIVDTLELIDSAGGTDIAAGLFTAIELLKTSTSYHEVTEIEADDLFHQIGATPLDSIEQPPETGITPDDAIVSMIQNFDNRMGIVIFTDGFNNAGHQPVCDAIREAICSNMRVHYGFLQPLTYDAPLGYGYPHNELSCSLEACGNSRQRAPSSIEEAVLTSGGVFGIIGDAASQLAFVEQIGAKGLTNSDGTDPGGQLLMKQIQTADRLSSAQQTRAFTFRGQRQQKTRIIVDTNGHFQPTLTVFNRKGEIVAMVEDEGDGLIDLALAIPRDGTYVAEVYSQDGNLGPFNIFISVKEVGLPVMEPKTTVSLKIKGSGTGSIISEPKGIDCGNRGVSDCSTSRSDFLYTCLPPGGTNCSYGFGQGVKSVVNLVAEPEPDSVFIGFGGHEDCSDGQLTMIDSRHCIAYFSTLHTLTITKAGAGTGEVTSHNYARQPTAIACGAECTGRFADNEVIFLKAMADPGSVFMYWAGDCSSDDEQIEIDMDVDKHCTAYFEQQ